MLFAALVLIAILTWIIFYYSKPWKNSPPGPRGLPLVGNMFQVERLMHISLGKWAKEYGSVFKMNLFGTNMVVVSDHKLVKELFIQSSMSGRMDLSLFDMGLNGKVHGLFNTEGSNWEELRHFSLRQLRDFGFGRKTMEESIMTEVVELISTLKETNGEPVTDIKQRLLLAVVNSLWFILIGKRNSQNDAELIELTTRATADFSKITEGGGLLMMAPWIARWFPTLSGYEKLKKTIVVFSNNFQTPVAEHKETYVDDYQRDFADAFLKQIYATTNPDSAFFGKVGEQNLVSTLGDFYFAGSDTTSGTLSWLILYVLKTPGVQERFQKEIEAVTGNTRPCSVSDRPNMPYTEALIAETLRYSSVAASIVQHRAMQDTEFKSYFIPKDTLITANLHFIHHNPAVWGDPEAFRPERFLSPDGKTFKKHDAMIAFSIGRRQCLGETLARDSVFLFATNIFQRFQLKLDPNGPDNGLDSEVAFLLTPKPFHVCFTDRLV